ncbi:MAG: hypothetical protein K8T91_26355 [Planctomycetes bacterium]|nr:hypothetical protein [Planctomycetota bacterium]
MTPNLSDQQRAALKAEGGSPISVLDEQTSRVYYLVSEDQYARIRGMLTADEFDPREAYPLIAKTAGAAGWDDPIMDEYNNYDEHRSQG